MFPLLGFERTKKGSDCLLYTKEHDGGLNGAFYKTGKVSLAAEK